MSTSDDAAIKALITACERDLGDPAQWSAPEGYPDSLALCIIDAIYSPGARYGQAAKVVERYRAYRAEQGGAADTDGVAELLATFDELLGAQAWATQMGNRRPVSTAKDAPLRATAIADVALELSALGLLSVADIRQADDATLVAAEQAWRSVSGQRSGLTWNYTLILAGVAGVKADQMVIRYVVKALDALKDEVTGSTAARLVKEAAEVKGWDVSRLDHWIWLFESGRLVSRDVA
jgi:hypothetical protein